MCSEIKSIGNKTKKKPHMNMDLFFYVKDFFYFLFTYLIILHLDERFPFLLSSKSLILISLPQKSFSLFTHKRDLS